MTSSIQKLTVDYGKSLLEAWKLSSVFEGLTEHDVNEIMKVQELYCLHLSRGRDVPDAIRYVTEESGFMYFFTMTKQKAASTASTIQYQSATWEHRMQGRGKLRMYATDIISEICGYQTRMDLEQDSAECMFLEEIKHWATYELALYELRPENLEEIEKRVKYFEAVLSQDKLFYSIKWRRKTAQQIILACTQRLKYCIVPDIRSEIALRCAREKLSDFRFDLKEALQQGIYFLYHVLRDSGEIHPDVITLNKLLEGSSPTMHTGSGKLLHHVLTTGAFGEAFPDDIGKIRRMMRSRSLQKDYVDLENEMDTSTLYEGETGDLVLPTDVWLDMVDPKSYENGGRNANREANAFTVTQDDRDKGYVRLDKSRLEMLFSRRLGTSKTGLESAFNGHPTVSEQFLKAHAQIHELAKFVQILIKAEKCAGGGGDLLLYGFANKQLNALLESYRNMVKMIRSQFEFVLRISELRFQDLVEKNKAEPERNTFVPHYRLIHNKFYLFSEQLDRTDKHCESILNEANSLTLMERFQQLQKDTDDFITNSDVFSKHINKVMGIPYNPAVGQKILLVGSGVKSAERLLDMVKFCSDDDMNAISSSSSSIMPDLLCQKPASRSSLQSIEELGEEEAEHRRSLLLPMSVKQKRTSRLFGVLGGGGGDKEKDGKSKFKSKKRESVSLESSSSASSPTSGYRGSSSYAFSTTSSSPPASPPPLQDDSKGEKDYMNLYKAFEYLDKSSCGALQLYEAPSELVESISIGSSSRRSANKLRATNGATTTPPLDVSYGSAVCTTGDLALDEQLHISPIAFAHGDASASSSYPFRMSVGGEGTRKVEDLERKLDILRMEKVNSFASPSSSSLSSPVGGISKASNNGGVKSLRRNSRDMTVDNRFSTPSTSTDKRSPSANEACTYFEDFGDDVLFELPPDDDEELGGCGSGPNEPYDWKKASKKAKKHDLLKRKWTAREMDASGSEEEGGGGGASHGKGKEPYEEWIENKFGKDKISFDARRFTDRSERSESTFGVYVNELNHYLKLRGGAGGGDQNKTKKFHLSMKGCFKRTSGSGAAVEPLNTVLSRFLDILCWNERLSTIRCLDLSFNEFSRGDLGPLVNLLCHPSCRIKVLITSGCSLTDEDFKHRGASLNLSDVLRSRSLQTWVLTNNPSLTDETVIELQNSISNRLIEGNSSLRFLYLGKEENEEEEEEEEERDSRSSERIAFTTTALNYVQQSVYKNLELFVYFRKTLRSRRNHPGSNDRTVSLGSIGTAESSNYAFRLYEVECLNRLRKSRLKKLEILKRERDSHEKRNRTAEYFKYLVRVCQIYERNTGSLEVPLSFVLSAFSTPFYGIPKAFSIENIVSYVAKARGFNVLRGPYYASGSREEPVAPLASDRYYALSKAVRGYEVPLPERVSLLRVLHDAKQICLGTLMPLLHCAIVGMCSPLTIPKNNGGKDLAVGGGAGASVVVVVVQGCESGRVLGYLSRKIPFSNMSVDVVQAMIEYGKILGMFYTIDQKVYGEGEERTVDAISDEKGESNDNKKRKGGGGGGVGGREVTVTSGGKRIVEDFPPKKNIEKRLLIINSGSAFPVDVRSFPIPYDRRSDLSEGPLRK